MSNAAPPRGLVAAPRPPPRPPGGWASISGTSATASAASLVNYFAPALAPAKSVRFAMQRLQHAAVIGGRPRRIAGDDDFVADLERIALDALLRERPHAAPFKRPALHHALGVRSLHLQKRMWVAQQHFHNLAFELQILGGIVS